MPIQYIIDRVRADARHVIDLSQNEEKTQHPGLRGGLRELLVDNILTPWLPPYVACGTGTIISEDNIKRESTQDDIILYDKTLTPPILGSQLAKEGIFLFNSVLARIEVKSTNDVDAIKAFCKSSNSIARMTFSVPAWFDTRTSITGCLNTYFAFKRDSHINADDNKIFLSFIKSMMNEGIDPLSGKISMFCILGAGFWKLGNNGRNMIWQKLIASNLEDQLSWFVATLSNSCFLYHAERQGRDKTKTLESGIGMYFDHPFEDIDYKRLL